MLTPVPAKQQLEVVSRWRTGPARRRNLANFLTRWDPATPPGRLLVDDPQRPTVHVGVHGVRITLQGSRRAARQWLKLLATGPRGVIPGWPDAFTKEQWQKDSGGRPYFRLAQVFASFLDIAENVGFVPWRDPDDHHEPHYLYWIAGKPRFTHLVKHACRLGVGQELHSLLVTGIPYDEDGEYTRQCLEKGPSFVCEVPSNPPRTLDSIKRLMGADRRIRIGDKEFSPQEISAVILRKLQQDAATDLNDTVGGGVAQRPRAAGLKPALPMTPVCWSCTHLGGAMGMIYTPEEHRGHGYGTSLGAFQVDHMLAQHGLAFAQVRWNNTASQRIMDKFGASRTREPLTRGQFFWK